MALRKGWIMTLKKTPLYNEHIKLGAKMVSFAGFEMPVQYSGVMDEHQAVRQHAGLFDVSHMGEFEFLGRDALPFLDYLTANDVTKLVDGKAHYSLLLNESGGVVDDILVYRIHEEHFIMVVNASNIEKDFKWIHKHQPSIAKIEINNISDHVCLLALQGPKALAIIQPLLDQPVADLRPFHFLIGTLAGQENCIIARTGYTGEDGVEIFCKNQPAIAIWQALLETGQPKGLKPVGLGARDTLRLEARLSLYGHEINDETHPFEAGLSWVVKMEKPNFIGKTALQKIKTQGLKRQLVGFKMVDKGIAREGFTVVDQDKRPIGKVTSGSYSPTLGQAIGLAYVPLDKAEIGTKFNVDIRGNLKLAEVIVTPFYKRR